MASDARRTGRPGSAAMMPAPPLDANLVLAAIGGFVVLRALLSAVSSVYSTTLRGGKSPRKKRK